MVSEAMMVDPMRRLLLVLGGLSLALAGGCLPDLDQALPADDDVSGDDDDSTAGDDDSTGDDDDSTGDDDTGDDDSAADDDTGDDDSADLAPRIEMVVASGVLDAQYRYEDDVSCVTEPGLWTFQAADAASPADSFEMTVDGEPVASEFHHETFHLAWFVGGWEVAVDGGVGCSLEFSTLEPRVTGRIACNDQIAVQGDLEEAVHIHQGGFICP